MKRSICTAVLLGALFAGHAAAETPAAEAPYTLSVTLIEHVGETRSARSVEQTIRIADGAFRAGNPDTFVVSGGMTVDEAARTARAELTVCRPGAAVCDPLVRPVLTFSIGQPVRRVITWQSNSVLVALSPTTEQG